MVLDAPDVRYPLAPENLVRARLLGVTGAPESCFMNAPASGPRAWSTCPFRSLRDQRVFALHCCARRRARWLELAPLIGIRPRRSSRLHDVARTQSPVLCAAPSAQASVLASRAKAERKPARSEADRGTGQSQRRAASHDREEVGLRAQRHGRLRRPGRLLRRPASLVRPPKSARHYCLQRRILSIAGNLGDLRRIRPAECPCNLEPST